MESKLGREKEAFLALMKCGLTANEIATFRKGDMTNDGLAWSRSEPGDPPHFIVGVGRTAPSNEIRIRITERVVVMSDEALVAVLEWLKLCPGDCDAPLFPSWPMPSD